MSFWINLAVIKEVAIFLGTLNVELIEVLKNTLTGGKYNKAAINAQSAALSTAQPEMASQVDDFSAWLVGEIKG